MAAEKQEIVFGNALTPEALEAHNKKIAAARAAGNVNMLKGNEPVGRVPRPPMPDFQKLRDAQSGPSSVSEEGGVQPRPPGSPLLSPQTDQQLKDMAKAASAASEQEKKEAESKKDEQQDILDMLDFNNQRTEAERLLNNSKRRGEIEARCEPMKFEDLLYKNEVQQKVPILPGKFEPTFRSFTPEESLFVKRYLAKEQAVSDQYLLEKYNICLLVCSLVAINDNQLPDHRNNQGEPDEKLFDAKLKTILKKSGYIIADLGINYTWFDIRVRKLVTVDGLKNG